MADDWDTATKIGKNVRTGGGGERETVVRGKSALNAANRSGAVVATEKKFSAGNSKTGIEGQHLTKVDRSDDIVKPNVIDPEVGKAMARRRQEMEPKITQKDLATKANVPLDVVVSYEKPNSAATPNGEALAKLEKVLNIKLRGKDGIGGPRFPAKKKDDTGAAKGGAKGKK